MRPTRNLIGQRFGRLTVIAAAPRHARGWESWLCRCDCGRERTAVVYRLAYGAVVSCGCGRVKHGQTRNARTPEYVAWISMRTRCRNPDLPGYENYGGRGIRVCDRWQTFENFFADMGSKPSPKHSLDRIDVNGHYEPGNCRWATRATQQRNRRCTKLEAHEPAQIRWLCSLGYTQTAVAKFFELDSSFVCNIVHGKAWAEVPR